MRACFCLPICIENENVNILNAQNYYWSHFVAVGVAVVSQFVLGAQYVSANPIFVYGVG